MGGGSVSRIVATGLRPIWVALSLTAALAACGDVPQADIGPPQTPVGAAPESASPAPLGLDAADTVFVGFETVPEIEAFFEEVSYTPQTWADGVRELPRMYTTQITERWRERTRTELDVQAKKRIFFRAMAPLALRSNELIREERAELQRLAAADTASESEWEWLVEVAQNYRVQLPARDAPPGEWEGVAEEVFRRVDEVPVSLVLAQAANESGWGTSRFAAEGNALFGQWSFGGSGMLPVVAYMRNLNSHPAYASLREARAAARAAGEPLSGWDLAGTLDRYSERGQDYVDELRGIIDFNRLQDADATFLAPGPVYLIVDPTDPRVERRN
jgi:uncharacterized FlgJ-related protein